MVSHACWLPLRSHSALSCGTTAEAENYNVIASSSAAARHAR
jgi:hypothetical protein